jgi:hypothetical protein
MVASCELVQRLARLEKHRWLALVELQSLERLAWDK